jgi:glycosyltransferase involved in cell wall biosynthesis
MARVLWIGDAGSHTGFSRVTHSIGERLVDDYGHDVHVLGFNHRGDAWASQRDPNRQTPLKLYRPNAVENADIWGKTRIVELLGKIEPDVVVLLHDANLLWNLLLENTWDPQQYLLRYRPVITYIPVDGYNRPPKWNEFLTEATNVVAMSKFGQAEYPGSQLVYHGIDSELFFPITPDRPITTSTGITVTSKRDAKRAFGFDPDGFLVLRVDKNSGRKDFASTIKALWPVMAKHTDIQVHLHTSGGGNVEDALLINNMLAREPALNKRFWLPGLLTSHVGWSEADLCALYNAADIFVSTSRGEGFGLTIAEALSCGVPVIAQNVSAIPEVVGPGGVLIEPLAQITVPNGSDQWLADTGAFSEAIEHLYRSAGARRDLGRNGREHVVRSFEWNEAAAKFHVFISALAAGGDTHGSGPGSVPGSDAGQVQGLLRTPEGQPVG